MAKFDIVFMSYQESNAEENWREILVRFPSAKRVHGVEGIYNAHKKAAEASETEFFFLIDGDNKIKPEFNFEFDIESPKEDTIYVWRCENPINDLVYGYGAVKLYNKSLLSQQSKEFRDLATTVARHYHIIDEVASETHFFATPLEAWRGSFRECAKLQSQVLENPEDKYSKERLEGWCTKANPEIETSDWVLKGAEMGSELAKDLSGDQARIREVINSFDELERRFNSI